jgi:hypothetical protein
MKGGTGVGATGMGLLLEEHRGEISTAWRQAVERELGVKDPALAFAVAPLLREMSLALGGEANAKRPSRDAWTRCAVLVRSTAASAQLAREFKLLHRTLWEALRARGTPVAPADRAAADEWLHEALAEALDRLERVRMRAAAFERGPVVIPPVARQQRPPPLPSRPALVAGRTHAVTDARTAAEDPIELEPISP